MFKGLFSLLFVFLFNFIYAQPEGGISLVEDPLTNYWSSGSTTISLVDIIDMPFSKAFSAPTPDIAMNPWEAQLRFVSLNDFSEGDIIFLSFYARSTYSENETGEGYLSAILEDKVSFEKTLYQFIACGASWTKYQIPFISTLSLNASESNFVFFVGYSNQTVEVADVQLLNYGSTVDLEDLPKTDFSYPGREDTASWRAEAAARIETYRKGDINFSVSDVDGNPIDSASIQVKMLNHQFRFGSAIVGTEFNSNKVYREEVYELFNEVVFENEMKWDSWISRTNHDYLLRVIDSLDKHKISARGHVLVWPSWQNTPDYLKSYENDPYNLDKEIIDHIQEVTEYTRSRLVDWDVINEPFDNHDLMDILGKEDMGIWFAKARETDPNAKLFINDYGILSYSGLNVKHQEHLYQAVQYIERYGGQVDGYGFQSHFGSGLTDISRVFDIIDRYASTGKIIKISEFDVNLEDQELQADYLRDFLTITFSHPAVKGFMNWGFWAGRHWEPLAAFYDTDWNIRPNGEVWKDLIYNHWWTNDTVLTNESGAANTSGFLGSYEFTIEKNGISLKDTLDVSSFKGATVNVILVSNGQMTIQNNAIPDTIIYFEKYNWNVEVPEIVPFIPEEIIPEHVEELASDEIIKIYPNPFATNFKISNQSDIKFTHYKISDLAGRELIIQEYHGDQTIDNLSELKPGIYSLQLISENQLVAKIIIKN